MPHRLHSLDTFVDRCVEIRDGVTTSRTTQRMQPERVVIARVVVVVAVATAIGGSQLPLGPSGVLSLGTSSQ
jgi:hypothetical protein